MIFVKTFRVVLYLYSSDTLPKHQIYNVSSGSTLYKETADIIKRFRSTILLIPEFYGSYKLTKYRLEKS